MHNRAQSTMTEAPYRSHQTASSLYRTVKNIGSVLLAWITPFHSLKSKSYPAIEKPLKRVATKTQILSHLSGTAAADVGFGGDDDNVAI